MYRLKKVSIEQMDYNVRDGEIWTFGNEFEVKRSVQGEIIRDFQELERNIQF